MIRKPVTTAPKSDEGSILMLVLVFSVSLALVVVALATYASTTLRLGQVAERSSDRLASANGAMDSALEDLERGVGPCMLFGQDYTVTDSVNDMKSDGRLQLGGWSLQRRRPVRRGDDRGWRRTYRAAAHRHERRQLGQRREDLRGPRLHGRHPVVVDDGLQCHPRRQECRFVVLGGELRQRNTDASGPVDHHTGWLRHAVLPGVVECTRHVRRVLPGRAGHQQRRLPDSIEYAARAGSPRLSHLVAR